MWSWQAEVVSNPSLLLTARTEGLQWTLESDGGGWPFRTCRSPWRLAVPEEVSMFAEVQTDGSSVEDLPWVITALSTSCGVED